MNLSVCRSYVRYFAFGQYIVICNIAESKVVYIPVFEIIYNFGAFAEPDNGGCGNSCACKCCGNPAFVHTAAACREVKAADRTDSIIFKCKQNVVCIEFYFTESVGSCQRQCNGLAEGNCHFAAIEHQLFRNDCMNCNRANLLAVINSGQNNIADGICGQNAIFVCTVCGSICNICGDFSRMTGCTYTCNTHCNRCAGSCILSFNIIRDMVKGLESDRS